MWRAPRRDMATARSIRLLRSGIIPIKLADIHRASRGWRCCQLDWIGVSSQLRDLGHQITALYQLGITLDHLERGILSLAPEADVELALSDTEVVNGEVRQPFRKRRVDIELVARRIRQKAQEGLCQHESWARSPSLRDVGADV